MSLDDYQFLGLDLNNLNGENRLPVPRDPESPVLEVLRNVVKRFAWVNYGPQQIEIIRVGRAGNIIKEHLLQSAEGFEENRRELEAAIEQRQEELRGLELELELELRQLQSREREAVIRQLTRKG